MRTTRTTVKIPPRNSRKCDPVFTHVYVCVCVCVGICVYKRSITLDVLESQTLLIIETDISSIRVSIVYLLFNFNGRFRV